MRRLSRVFSFLVITAFSFAVIGTSAPQVAHAVGELNWYSADLDLVEGETISGNKRVNLRTNFRYSGRYVTKWCIYLDGQAITGSSYDADYNSPIWGIGPAVYVSYEGGVAFRQAGNQTSSGCWTTTLADRAYGFDVTLNTSTWSNGSHAVSIEATISDATVISKTTTVISSNTDSAVEWITTGPLNAERTMSLTAKITPRVNRISKVCLTRDGTAIQRSELSYFVGNTRYNGMWGGPTGTFGSTTGGCVLFDEDQDNALPRGLWQATTLTISLYTSTWTAIPAALTLTITESIGREFSADIAFNPAPPTTTAPTAPSPTTTTAPTAPSPQTSTTTTTAVPTSSSIPWTYRGVTEGQKLSGWTDIDLIRSFSINVSGSHGLCLTGMTAGKSCDWKYVTNTACLKNGPQQLTVTATEKFFNSSKSQPWSDSKKYNVLIDNGAPSLGYVKATNKKPNWKNSTTSGSIDLVAQFGCSYVITLKTSSSKAKTLTGLLAADSTNVAFSGLKQKTRYTAVASVISENGTVKKTFKFTTPAIPAKPRPTYSGGSSSGSSGGSSGGSSYPNVVGWQLDRAMSASSAFSYKQYSSCYQFDGFENGFAGIWNTSNWVVVTQSGPLLYVCKRD
jgi:hypothetical protein